MVVYLDQRGAGRSFDAKADPRALTIARHVKDLDLVVDQICREQGQSKVVLLGHSWGRLLAYSMPRPTPRRSPPSSAWAR
uniref:Alpha/beta fold hydrolase n=1 Tax=Phenylobacterium glaciei TaxID=2803784 RepID=A0A974S8D3_9CAUL|nr:alpha/beta fold hydrolase [Phenylobacterium glaciei]